MSAPLNPQPSTLNSLRAFTLLELLTVITIMGIIAALAVPTLRGLKPNAKVAGTRELVDAVGRARQLAISQRTTVYMVFACNGWWKGNKAFLPNGFWTDPASASWTRGDWTAATNLLEKQLIGYAYVCLRSVGDQPGAHTPRYLSSWRTLPQGAYISLQKLTNNFTIPGLTVPILAFSPANGNVTHDVPFPLETTPQYSAAQHYIGLPYIAFDGTGQLVSGLPGQPELIPVSEGIVSFARDAKTKVPLPQPAQVIELPAGNTIDNYSLVYIDRLTGRARVERRKVQ